MKREAELHAVQGLLNEAQRQVTEKAADAATLGASLEQERKAFAEKHALLTLQLEGGERRLGTLVESERSLRLELAQTRELAASQDQQITTLKKSEDELRVVRTKLERLQQESNEKSERMAALIAELDQVRLGADQKLEMQRDLHAQLEERFNGLAAQVLERNTEKFESNTKVRLNEMADVLAGHVKTLQQKVEQTHSQDVQDRIALRTELQKMVEATRRIDEDAANLTRALTTDRKTQGAWGELVLSRILEQCGLRLGVEYETQCVHTNDADERLRPDVIVKLPGGRSVVIDAKVSLKAYSEFIAADTDEQAFDARQRHVASVRSHIKGLAGKEYWRLNGLDTGDYVLMFLPLESAFAEALRAAPGLFEEAFTQHVVLTSPATLLATLRTIEHTWRVERQNATARAIVEQAGRLYDKMAGFVEDLKKVGTSLDAAQRAYNGAHNKLSSGRGNLVGQADRLRELGVKLKKVLPAELVDQARAGELLLSDDDGVADCVEVTALLSAGGEGVLEV